MIIGPRLRGHAESCNASASYPQQIADLAVSVHGAEHVSGCCGYAKERDFVSFPQAGADNLPFSL